MSLAGISTADFDVTSTEEPAQPILGDPAAVEPVPSPVKPVAEPVEPEPAAAKVKAEPESIQARINKLTWEREEAKRQAASLKAEAEALRAKVPAEPLAPVESFPAYDVWLITHPTQSYEDYTDARTDWRFEQREQKATAAREAQERITLGAAHEARMAIARQTYPDFDDVLSAGELALRAAGFPTVPPLLADAIVRSEKSAAILHDLGTHPEVCVEMARLAQGQPASAVPMMRHLLESRLSAAPSGPAEPTARVTRAQPPIKPVGSSLSAVEPDALSDDSDVDTHIRVMNARDRQRRRA